MSSKLSNIIKILSISMLLNVSTFGFSISSVMQIEKIVQAGTGCKSKELELDQDYFFEGKWLIIKQEEDYVAKAGAGIPLSASRKNCQYNIRFVGEENSFKVAIDNVFIIYNHELPLDEVADVAVRTHIQGSSESSVSELKVTGKGSSKYNFLSHKLEPLHTPCDQSRSLNLGTSLRVSPSLSGLNQREDRAALNSKFIAQKSYLFAKINIESCEDEIEIIEGIRN